MSTQYVLGYIAIVILSFKCFWESVQLTRPDDDWKGWVEPNVPYKRPRWGVQPGPLLKLVVLVPMIFLLADWLKNGATSVMAVWLK
jgi:hypothetical protein